MKHILPILLLCATAGASTLTMVAGTNDMLSLHNGQPLPSVQMFVQDIPVMPPPANLTTWLVDNDGTNATARVGTNAVVTDVSCLAFASAGTITTAGITTNSILTHSGTSTLTAGTGVINCGTGTVSGIKVDGVMRYPLTATSGLTAYDVSGNGNHGTISGATWTTADGIPSYFALYGGTLASVFDGVDDYIDTLVMPDINTELIVDMEFLGDGMVVEWFGYFNTGGACQFGLDGSGNFNAYFGNKSQASITGWEGRHTFTINKSGFWIDGIQKATWTGTTFATSMKTVLIAARNREGAAGPERQCEGNIFNVSIGGLYLSPSLTTNGMVDTLTGTVYTNSGTGDLGLGFIPALSDGTADATGGEITNPGGYVHNGGPFSLVIGGTTNTYANLVALTNNYGAVQASYDATTRRIRNVSVYSVAQTNDTLNAFLDWYK